MSSDADRLKKLQADFEAALEGQITDLLTHVKATQAVTARLASTQQEILVQERLQEQLKAEMEPLTKHAAALQGDSEKLRKRIEQLKENIRRMRAKRKELVDTANGLAEEARAASKA
ncbi:MAG: hypothetical protein EA397_10030 [Deltaproteobacteria bacterium]|nr:MAG: hypothetical protein EA397_10030 [Deltaproteobacteria bacterium]